VLGGRSHYQVLGVDQDADADQLSAAYQRLASQYDPALYAHEPDPNRQAAIAAVRLRIDEAYRTLATPEQRRQYDSEIGSTAVAPGAQPEPTAKPDFARKDTRFPISRPVKIRCSNWDQAATVYTRDVSRGGIFLRSENPVEVGTPITVTLVLPDGNEISLEGEVAYALPKERAGPKGPGIGVRFRELDGEVKTRFEDLLIEAAEAAEESTTAKRRPKTEPPVGQGLPARPLLEENPFEENVVVPEEPAEEPVPQPVEPETSYMHVTNRLVATGHALIALGEGRYPDAREKLTALLRKHRDNRYLRALYHLAFGYELKAAGRADEARKHFEMVLRYDKQCVEAISELRSGE
jgi:uncharacterized protein (TIGR02266 family)